MRISDWSPDVCSSDLAADAPHVAPLPPRAAGPGAVLPLPRLGAGAGPGGPPRAPGGPAAARPRLRAGLVRGGPGESGRASSRERACQYVEISVVAVSLKQNTHTQRPRCT